MSSPQQLFGLFKVLPLNSWINIANGGNLPHESLVMMDVLHVGKQLVCRTATLLCKGTQLKCKRAGNLIACHATQRGILATETDVAQGVEHAEKAYLRELCYTSEEYALDAIAIILQSREEIAI